MLRVGFSDRVSGFGSGSDRVSGCVTRKFGIRIRSFQMDLRTTQILIGASYFLLSASILPVYLAILWVFLTEPTFKTNFSYRIMTAVGAGQCIMMVITSINGLMLISNSNLNYTFEKVSYLP
ncbi:hypothetical protein L596_026410 [Steinernema carpocapsae]|uniref:Uncharacterized protein n=1 Tax=Steinernema carpocapsae TaxID=34508 RepID=A0A4U5M2A0_STECR|nr:hypothetical protein L596_026410 [Steinernema carpocapsae]